MAGLGTIALIAGLAGSAVSAVGTIAAGRNRRALAEFEGQQADIQAKQLEIQGKEQFAEAQREAQEIERNKRIVLSRQQAVAAASGLGPTDPTVVNLASEVAGYGDEQRQRALTAGKIRRQNLELAAENTRASGQATRAGGQMAYTGSLYDAGGTILGGFANAFQMKYGNGGFRPAASGYGASGSWYG